MNKCGIPILFIFLSAVYLYYVSKYYCKYQHENTNKFTIFIQYIGKIFSSREPIPRIYILKTFYVPLCIYLMNRITNVVFKLDNLNAMFFSY